MKICIIGGGSAYIASFFQEIINAGEKFANDEFVLMDIDEEHLRLMYKLGCTMFNVAKHSTRLQMTTNRLKALEGADFVLTTFRPGGFAARYLDESIPLRYGVIGNETVGPGGLFMACRAIPVMLEIAQDVEQVCPNATIVNYTNPTNLVTGAVKRYSSAKIVGICDQHVGERHALAKLLGVQQNRLRTICIGLNHATWITGLYLDGKNILNDLSCRIRMGGFCPKDDSLYKSLELCGIYDLFPTYYLRYYYYAEEMLKIAIQTGYTRTEEILRELPLIWQSYEESIKNKLIHPLRQRGKSDHGEFALKVIAALASDKYQVLTVNTVNGGALPDFPPTSIVEGPAVVSQLGVQLLSQPSLPKTIIGLMQQINSYEELAIEAAVKGNKDLLVKALIAHPLVKTLSTARQLVDDLLIAHQTYLPQFKNL